MSRLKPVQRRIAEGDPRRRGKRKLQQALDSQPKAASCHPRCPAFEDPRSRHIDLSRETAVRPEADRRRETENAAMNHFRQYPYGLLMLPSGDSGTPVRNSPQDCW